MQSDCYMKRKDNVKADALGRTNVNTGAEIQSDASISQ